MHMYTVYICISVYIYIYVLYMHMYLNKQRGNSEFNGHNVEISMHLYLTHLIIINGS